MRKRHNVSQTVKSFVKMISNNEISFDYPVQRAYNQWNHLQQSLLIHSVLTDFDVPSVYAVGAKEDEKAVYSIIDGKQRLSVLSDFMNNKFSLHKNTPSVVIEDTEYDVAQHTYEELPEVLQDTFKDYNLMMIYFINITDAEIFEMFYRLNNGAPLSAQQKAKSKMGMDIAVFIKQMCASDFISKLNISDNQRKKADDELILVQGMMLMDEEHVIKKFNAKDATDYAENLKNKDSSFLEKVKNTIEYLNNVYKDKEVGVELKKVSAPMLIAVASTAGEIEPNKFYEWTQILNEIILDENSEYAQFLGQGTTNKSKVEGRHAFLQKSLESYMNQILASAN